MHNQQGFTLIELMIVVVIIGVLAMIAIPQFQNHTASSQASRVLMETSQLRSQVELCLVQGLDIKTQTNTAEDGCDVKLNSDLLKDGKAVINTENTDAQTSAVITATFAGNASKELHNKKIVWKLDKTEGWQCTTDIDKKLAPKGCNLGVVSSES